MFYLRTRTALDKAFAIGLALKGLNAAAELVGGLWLLFVSPTQLQDWASVIFAPSLRQDSTSFVATHALHWIGTFKHGAVLFTAIYLLAHGIAKLVVVAEILRGRSWAYPGLIILTALFVVYQIYHMAMSGISPGYLFLTAFDLLIIALTIAEYARLRAHQV